MSFELHKTVTAVLLAAGVGRRLGQGDPRPKVLLEFGGRSLLARHVEALAAAGVDELVIVTGFEAEQIEGAVAALKAPFPIRMIGNPRFTEGSIVSLAAARDVLRSGATVVLMDGDVLYDRAMLTRMLASKAENALLVDRELEPGDEPVKLCFDAARRIVDFRKTPEHPGAWHGESVGSSASRRRPPATWPSGRTGMWPRRRAPSTRRRSATSCWPSRTGSTPRTSPTSRGPRSISWRTW
jgi:choline kinase